MTTEVEIQETMELRKVVLELFQEDPELVKSFFGGE